MIAIDLKKGVVTTDQNGKKVEHTLASPEGFHLVSKAWMRAAWDAKYMYGFTWLGRPVIQMPEDMIRIQEVIFTHKPDVVIETGIAHGGSLIFYASLFKAMGRGRVIGVDIEIRPHNRKAMEDHPLTKEFITMIEGSSTDPKIVDQVRKLIKPGEKVMVILDSNHTKQHVLDELNCYADMVTPGCYIVACDGIMQEVVGAPRTQPDWITNNPKVAAEEWLKKNPNFKQEHPGFLFNEGVANDYLSAWPGAWLKRVK